METRILIVDDSSVVRRMLAGALEATEDIRVSGTAANGRIALQKVHADPPDLIILDIDMPEMDGLQTLEELGRNHPSIPVIMFSVLTERGAQATLQALFRGAQDYVTKPAGAANSAEAIRRVREELIPKIRALVHRQGMDGRTAQKRSRRPSSRPGKFEVVLIASSTGGPAALGKLLGQIKSPPPVPILIVQHMPELFTAYLARQLCSQTGLDIREAVDGEEIAPAKILLAPGGRHMKIAVKSGKRIIRLDDSPPLNSCRPSADALFFSAADAWKNRVLAVVLTGMGKDGLEGSRRIHRDGGRILAQDESSSVVWGMPGYIVEAGLTGEISDPVGLGETLRQHFLSLRSRP